MNDEIKEILDALEVRPEEITMDYSLVLTIKQQKVLLDYINNLQERIDKAIEYIKDNITWYYDEDLDESVYQDEVSGDKILNILKGDSDK